MVVVWPKPHKHASMHGLYTPIFSLLWAAATVTFTCCVYGWSLQMVSDEAANTIWQLYIDEKHLSTIEHAMLFSHNRSWKKSCLAEQSWDLSLTSHFTMSGYDARKLRLIIRDVFCSRHCNETSFSSRKVLNISQGLLLVEFQHMVDLSSSQT